MKPFCCYLWMQHGSLLVLLSYVLVVCSVVGGNGDLGHVKEKCIPELKAKSV